MAYKSEGLCAETQCGMNAVPQNIATHNISKISAHAKNEMNGSEKTHWHFRGRRNP